MSHRLLVLAWHNVEPTWCFPASRGAGARGLGRQLAFLGRRCNVVPLADALRALDRDDPLPPRAVALTFDDGYRDQLELAAPMLSRLGLPATFFLVPGLLDGTARAWWELLAWTFTRSTRDAVVWEGRILGLRDDGERRRSLATVLEELKRRDHAGRNAALDELKDRCSPDGKLEEHASFLDWDGARQLVRQGLMVASHSLNHAILAQEPTPAQERDLTLSRRRLERELDVPVELFAYPNGVPGQDYAAEHVAMANACGFRAAVSTAWGAASARSDRFQLPRFTPWDRARWRYGARLLGNLRRAQESVAPA